MRMSGPEEAQHRKPCHGRIGFDFSFASTRTGRVELARAPVTVLSLVLGEPLEGASHSLFTLGSAAGLAKNFASSFGCPLCVSVGGKDLLRRVYGRLGNANCQGVRRDARRQHRRRCRTFFIAC